MKALTLSILAIFLTISVVNAQGIHRLGIGAGSISGVYTEPGLSIDMSGSQSEVPNYSYTFNTGLTLFVHLRSMDIEGSLTMNGVTATTFYELDVLTFGIGYSLKPSDTISIIPSFIVGNGSGKFHYTISGLGSSPIYSGDGSISGIEVPVYFDINPQFYLGVKPGIYGGGSEVQYPSGDTGEIEFESGFQFLAGAIF